ncbi:hypothetical protein [Thiolapillus sp.]|uniref:hypothetical protein n=1 Tax=Thiolapillus sp. TaxID=2017437 RepID=UPI003AF55BBA
MAKTINTEFFGPNPDNPGFLRVARKQSLREVEQQILDVLSDIKSTSDEDTTLDHLHEWVSYGYDQNTGGEREPDAPFPPGAPFVAMRVGNNEGLRIDVLTEETLDSGTAIHRALSFKYLTPYGDVERAVMAITRALHDGLYETPLLQTAHLRRPHDTTGYLWDVSAFAPPGVNVKELHPAYLAAHLHTDHDDETVLLENNDQEDDAFVLVLQGSIEVHDRVSGMTYKGTTLIKSDLLADAIRGNLHDDFVVTNTVSLAWESRLGETRIALEALPLDPAAVPPPVERNTAMVSARAKARGPR